MEMARIGLIRDEGEGERGRDGEETRDGRWRSDPCWTA